MIQYNLQPQAPDSAFITTTDGTVKIWAKIFPSLSYFCWVFQQSSNQSKQDIMQSEEASQETVNIWPHLYEVLKLNRLPTYCRVLCRNNIYEIRMEIKTRLEFVIGAWKRCVWIEWSQIEWGRVAAVVSLNSFLEAMVLRYYIHDIIACSYMHSNT